MFGLFYFYLLVKKMFVCLLIIYHGHEFKKTFLLDKIYHEGEGAHLLLDREKPPEPDWLLIMEVNEPQENYITGWIKVYRSIQEHWIWKDPKKLKWWLDLLLETNHSDKKVPIGYDLIECKRGQTIRSLSGWADRWNVSKDVVRNFFEMLKSDRMISTENLIKTTRITICNYDSYQQSLHAEQTHDKRVANAEQTRADRDHYTNKNVKNYKNDNNKQPGIAVFDVGGVEIKSAIDITPNGDDAGKKNPPRQKYKQLHEYEIDDVLKEKYETWVEFRKSKNKSISGLAMQKQIEFLKKFSTQDACKIIDQSIMNDWQGLFELKQTGQIKSQNGMVR